MKYIYPAVFTKEDEGGYSVDFPDLEGCYTCGEDLSEAIYMAEDVLALTLVHYEDEKREIPAPSERENISLAENEFINYVGCDTTSYRRTMNSKAVKKTLSIPAWLNEAATAAGVNFSQVLQDALKSKLDLV